MSDDDFDYGEKLDDGQYENHPTIDEGEFVAPIRKRYVHDECDEVTKLRLDIAESLARDPNSYTKTFCANCGDYFPLDEFTWKDTDVTVGEVDKDG